MNRAGVFYFPAPGEELYRRSVHDVCLEELGAILLQVMRARVRRLSIRNRSLVKRFSSNRLTAC